MTTCESLENEALNSGIDVLSEAIPVPGMTTVYHRMPNGHAQIVLSAEAEMARACDPAEELGHHCTGGNVVLLYDCPEAWKAEALARKWAHDRLLFPDVIRTAARNASDIYELSETLGLTVQFLCEAVDDYISRGLWACL